jgi:hypothetical protein
MPNNREWALLIWMAVCIPPGIALSLALPQLRGTVLTLLKTLVHPKIVTPALLMAAWMAVSVLVGASLGWWTADLATGTIFWFLGTALVRMFSIDKAVRGGGFLRGVILPIFTIGGAVTLLIKLYTFNLVLEIILLPTSTLLAAASVAAHMDPRLKRAKIVVDFPITLLGFAVLTFAAYSLVTEWRQLATKSELLKLALPVWLIGCLVPFLFLFTLYVVYEGTFAAVDFAAKGGAGRWRVKLAVALQSNARIQEVADFRSPWVEEALNSSGLRQTMGVVKDFRDRRERNRRAKNEQKQRLRRYAGVQGVDDKGRRLDQREFKETEKALQWLATAQMGWYRNRGGRYRDDLLEMLQMSFERDGLPPDHGISLRVAPNGQAWWAWRRTVTGWCLAIGSAGPPPDQWLYDGPEPPTGPPTGIARGGWSLYPKNW